MLLLKVIGMMKAGQMTEVLGATEQIMQMLAELELGLWGKLTMPEPMQKLMYSFASDIAPAGTCPVKNSSWPRLHAWWTPSNPHPPPPLLPRVHMCPCMRISRAIDMDP